MKKFIRHFVSFFLVAVMIVSSNITAFAANEKPVDSRFLPEITYTEDNTSTTRVPNLIPITVNPYYNKLVVHVGNLGVDSIDSVTWKETQAKSNVFSILLAFQTLSSRQLNNRGFSLIILNSYLLQFSQTATYICFRPAFYYFPMVVTSSPNHFSEISFMVPSFAISSRVA